MTDPARAVPSLKVTVDTTDLVRVDEVDQIRTIAGLLGMDVAWVTVTDRELGRVPESSIYETAVLGESSYGSAVWGSDEGADLFERILKVISSGSFPAKGRRYGLSDGHTHQLRDAMIFEAHVREGRDVFVTGDKKGFIDEDRRTVLEMLGSTRILTPDEFRIEYADE